MICTKLDSFLRKKVMTDLEMTWEAELKSGVTVYGDYERSGQDNPWNRLSKHCEENNDSIIKIKLLMFGAKKETFFEDENGLDGIFVLRGAAKEQTMSDDSFRVYQTLTVGLLRDDCDSVDVKKYCWPNNEFEQGSSSRKLTAGNLEYMIFKNESEKLKHPKVQELINGAAV